MWGLIEMQEGRGEEGRGMTREEIAAYKVDKADWGEGPWQTEPDRVDFVHEGLACLALRNPRHGNWCGYAAVPLGHPLYGKDYGEPDVEVHGGLTYADRCSGPICHVPAAGEPDDVWWFGFDCAHAFDLAPGMEARERELCKITGRLDIMERRLKLDRALRDVYRDLPYVRHKIERLAEQLAAVV